MTNDDIDYFRQRAEQEDSRAAACGDAVVAEIHRQLAAAYRARLNDQPEQSIAA